MVHDRPLTGTLGVGSSEDVLGRVRQLLDRGLFDEALKTLSTIAADDPRWPEANVLREKVRRPLRRARCLRRRGPSWDAPDSNRDEMSEVPVSRVRRTHAVP